MNPESSERMARAILDRIRVGEEEAEVFADYGYVQERADRKSAFLAAAAAWEEAGRDGATVACVARWLRKKAEEAKP